MRRKYQTLRRAIPHCPVTGYSATLNVPLWKSPEAKLPTQTLYVPAAGLPICTSGLSPPALSSSQ
jgi:hypothetical protein